MYPLLACSSVRIKTKGSKDFIIKILVTGIVHREFSMTRAMESAAAEEIRKLRRYMGVLDTMITVAPLLGIFGTVIGIIMSFEALGSAGIEHPQAVTAGIAQALITTATGLGILEIVYEKLIQPSIAQKEDNT